MYKDHFITLCTPVGRKRYLEVLSRYVCRKNSVVDEWRLWYNTTNPEDQQYVRDLQAKYPNFVSIDHSGKPTGNGYGVGQFYVNCKSDDTIYIKADDDIILIDELCIENLLECRLKHSEAFVIYANTINNAVCSHFLQKAKKLPLSWEPVQCKADDAVGWRSAEFAKRLHEYFLEKRTSDFYLPDINVLPCANHFSINFFAWFGKDFKQHFVSTHDDEQYISNWKPREIGKPTILCGNALVSHFAYYTQRQLLDSTNLLSRYAKLAETIEPRAGKRRRLL